MGCSRTEAGVGILAEDPGRQAVSGSRSARTVVVVERAEHWKVADPELRAAAGPDELPDDRDGRSGGGAEGVLAGDIVMDTDELGEESVRLCALINTLWRISQ